ncbi:hypothetical protein GCK32_005311 [Trichostrongylus colubriformis]|uniref:Protein kinase domain-containing protein n=1 Tax=Trichostrongylus colubriformis TaxID=6319 RepID=A0AAN8ERV6_TRICO
MLRLYRIMAKHSRKMGASKVFEKVEEQGRFLCSLKFHVLWAETYAQSGNLDRFMYVLNLARSRLPDLPPMELEAGFRDLADKYFPNSDIFNDDEETMAVFNIQRIGDSKMKRNRRRSSLAAFEARAKDTFNPTLGPAVATFGPKTRTKLRFELIDRPEDGYLAPSIEELRAAMVADQQMENNDNLLDVSMDITMTYPQETPIASHHPPHAHDLKELGKRNRVLETVQEVDSGLSSEDKRRRVFSPEAPVRGSILGKKQKSPVDSSKSTQPSSSATFITGSSFTEKAYNDMKAMLSDTVDINKVGGLPVITDDTTLPVTAPPTEAFEVFIDKDETQRPPSRKHEQENFSSRPADDCRAPAGRAPLQQIPLQVAGGDSEKVTEIKKKGGISDLHFNEDVFKPQKLMLIEDEETMAGAKFASLGIDKKPHRGIVTSTPAHQMLQPPTHEDFFAPLNHELEEQTKKEEEEEEIYAKSAFMRRRSVAPSKSVTPAPKAAVPQARTVQAAERSMELALDKMKLGDTADVVSDNDDDALNRTGVGLVMESVTSMVNPWDRNLRMEILRRSRVPCYQHNFETPCPRVNAGKTMSFGGEDFHIATLIGQGAFAKVYKAVDEEGKTLALKYEVPSCPWEVYICSEAKLRLGHSKQFTLNAVMEITDAYVFTNASVLFNEYHPFGTLLDLSNKLNDPSWYIILLIAIQLAKILRDVHSVKIIHGDVKPDNFMILTKLNEGCEDVNRILDTPAVKLIDWGRAIDMRALPGHTFTGRAGTDKFDCSEMLDLSNKLNDPSWYIILLIAIQLAKILRDVHSVKIIHGDVKPDNFMILTKLNEGCEDVNRILDTPVVKLIDWGRAIDMRALPGHTFTGRAGTDKFDCSEMLDGRPWTYQTDYFGFVGTVHVVIFNKYAEIVNLNGEFKPECTMKRRLTIRPLIESIFHDFLNIPSCDCLPGWDKAIKGMEEHFMSEFSVSEWRQAASRFNACLLRMLRPRDADVLKKGLRDALQMLECTPVYEQSEESYMKAIQEAEKLDVQLSKDREVLRDFAEMNPSAALRLEKLMKQYEERCAESDAVGSNADVIAKLRARHPQPLESDEPEEASSNAREGEEMTVVEVVRKLRDPLGGGQIKDPVKSKHCGHVYDRKTLQEYINSNRARRAMFYQCPYSLCTNKRNMDMKDMIDCPEYLST